MSTYSHFRQLERRAWLFIWSAFLIFCLLCVSIPSGFYWYMTRATEEAVAQLQVMERPIYLNNRLIYPSADSKVRVRVGDVISTHTGGRAVLWLDFDGGSNVRILPDSELRVVELHTNKFNWGRNKSIVTLEQISGYSRLEVSTSSGGDHHFRMKTREASIDFQEGSHSVGILPPTDSQQLASLTASTMRPQPRRTEVAVRHGVASITNRIGNVSLADNQKIEIIADEPLSPPLPARWELLQNSNFTNGIVAWDRIIRSEVGRGDVRSDKLEEREVILFERQSNDHSEDGIRQLVNRDVSEFTSLKLNATFKVLEHSLSGGGVSGSEYPLSLIVQYRDQAGNINTWRHGFWSQNNDNYPTTLFGSLISERVEQGSWVTYKADLFDESMLGAKKPVYIISIEINCQGHTYRSAVDSVSLLGE